jgi:hypothetical protein
LSVSDFQTSFRLSPLNAPLRDRATKRRARALGKKNPQQSLRPAGVFRPKTNRSVALPPFISAGVRAVRGARPRGRARTKPRWATTARTRWTQTPGACPMMRGPRTTIAGRDRRTRRNRRVAREVAVAREAANETENPTRYGPGSAKDAVAFDRYAHARTPRRARVRRTAKVDRRVARRARSRAPSSRQNATRRAKPNTGTANRAHRRAPETGRRPV